MASLPKPLIGLLLATVATFALWFVALKPNSSTSGGSPDGVGQYQSAINQAHQAVATSNAANAKLGAPTATGPAPKSPTPAKVAAKPTVKTAAKAVGAAKTTTAHAKAVGAAKTTTAHAKAKPVVKKIQLQSKPVTPHAPVTPSAAAEVQTLQAAVAAHKVVAVLFYNPAATDDQAMAQELGLVPTQGGEVVKLAIPVSELTEFQAITAQIPVVTAPTLILIDPARQATVMTGYASQLEINQRVADALATR
jgi:hypothetical protein